MPDCHVIHASGKVRIDKLDHFGIFNRELNRYTHQLRIVKRVLADESASSDTDRAGDSEDELMRQTALFD